MLFVDLVGFTPLSEGRDPEEVRELLSRYFDIARTVVTRYGGTIEKFIGDAVMAVWGTPVAVEGDAERAVRAAMELVSEVADLGASIAAPGLAARAGVVTGTVAATMSAEGQAMVAGDAVNTAARVQSAATAGTVLVDTTTRRLAGLAIEFDLHGDVELKGKTEPETLWQAREIVSGIGGAQRSDGLEAPFVGRAVEFGLLKDVLHATKDQRRPRLVLVSGPAGVGKTRLGWELEKYVDGLAENVYWHRGRCPTFGEDTAFWALTEIVRARLGVGEDDDRSQIEDKLATTLATLFDDETDRVFVAARLAPLLGLPSTGAELPQAELFAGWRRFFEGLARRQPVLLLVEDLHDADEGLLDFLEHLVDWVRDLPVLVFGFARSELVDRRPSLGTGRNRTLVTLSPLAEADMHALLAGLVAQLPPEAAAAIEAQAEGIPLFAVETVRSLIDQEVVVASSEGYSLAGDLGELAVPESLHALLAARLDALDPVARSLAAAAAVIAGPFMADTLVAVAAHGAGPRARRPEGAHPPRRAPGQRRRAVAADRVLQLHPRPARPGRLPDPVAPRPQGPAPPHRDPSRRLGPQRERRPGRGRRAALPGGSRGSPERRRRRRPAGRRHGLVDPGGRASPVDGRAGDGVATVRLRGRARRRHRRARRAPLRRAVDEVGGGGLRRW